MCLFSVLTFVARKSHKTTTHLLKLLSGKRGVAPSTPTRGLAGDPGLLYFKNEPLSPMYVCVCVLVECQSQAEEGDGGLVFFLTFLLHVDICVLLSAWRHLYAIVRMETSVYCCLHVDICVLL